MLDLFHIINPIDDLRPPEWTVVGASNAWEAVTSDSTDSTYISSDELSTGNSTELILDNISFPPPIGQIAGFLVHVRFKAATTGTAQIIYELYRNETLLGSKTVSTTNTDWVDDSFWVQKDPDTGERFNSVGSIENFNLKIINDNGALEINYSPIYVSKFYIEAVWMSAEKRYDALFETTPDSLIGDLQWSSNGTSSATISSDLLVINDSSGSDHKSYEWPLLELSSNYGINLSGRFKVESSSTGLTARLGSIVLPEYSIEVCTFLDPVSSQRKIGLTTYSAINKDTSTDYVASVNFDWTDFFHIYLYIDLDNNIANGIKLFVNNEQLLENDLARFNDTTGNSFVGFGSGDPSHETSNTILYVDYIDYVIERVRKRLFPYWISYEEGINRVEIDNTDSDIIKLFDLEIPPVQVGQSNYCCRLDVNDVSTKVMIGAPFFANNLKTYAIDIDYKTNDVSSDLGIVIQKAKDLYYWNNSTSTWQSSLSFVSLPGTLTRTRATSVITNLNHTQNDYFIIYILPVSTSTTYSSYVYKVKLYTT